MLKVWQFSCDQFMKNILPGCARCLKSGNTSESTSQFGDGLHSFYLLLATSPYTHTHASSPPPQPLFIHGESWQMLTLIKSKWRCLDITASEGLRKISVLNYENDKHFTVSVCQLMCLQTTPVRRSCCRDPCWVVGPSAPCLVWCQLQLLLRCSGCSCWWCCRRCPRQCLETSSCSLGSGCFLI